MGVEYINFKNQKYYLYSSLTKKGNPRYIFTLKHPETIVQTIPAGYEIYENPNGRVFLRKIVPALFSSTELDIVRQAINKYSKIKNVKVDIKKKYILIFTPDQDADELLTVLKSFAPANKKDSLKDAVKELLTFFAVMRFEIIDSEKRLFIPQRYSFMGSKEMWIDIGEPEKLDNLCKKFIKHLGQESFFELGIF